MKFKKTFNSDPLSIKRFHKIRKKILFWHEMGGLGDVLIHRMLFDDVKRVMPDCEIVFACLPDYFDAARDHPLISEVIDSRLVNPSDYLVVYNTCVTIADRYEYTQAPCDKNRADIWAESIGLKLTTHEMQLTLSKENIQYGRDKLNELKTKDAPTIALIPTSAMVSKNLTSAQIQAILKKLKDFNVFGINKKFIHDLTIAGIPCLVDQTIPQWMGVLNAADYVISVDTAAFHLCGGLKKPLMGIFGWSDGLTYGKYYDFVLVQKHRLNGNWDCGPCFCFNSCPKSRGPVKPCITELSIEEIYVGIDKMFKKWPK